MTKLKSREQIEAERLQQQRAREVVIDISKPAAIYARQSAKEQSVKNKQAKAMQTEDLLDLAEEYGWARESVYIFVENYYNQYGEYDPQGKPRHASGKLRIDSRPGLQHVLHLVETNQVSAVIVRETSRLFRDETGCLPPVFVEACKQHSVVVITPAHIYSLPTSRDDRKKLRDEADAAAAYLETLREIAHKAKHRKGARGKYSGHAVPTGFMLTPDREGYEPNPLWAPIVADITHRFRQLGGDIAALRRELFNVCVFPELPEHIASRVGKIYLTPVDGGYTLKNRGGLIHLLCNVANIGHMHFGEEITKFNAHSPIVDVDDFLFAMRHLSSHDLDGHKIIREKPAIRIPQKGTVSRDGLLSGVRSSGRPVLVSDQGNVHLFQTKHNPDASYSIKNGVHMSLNMYIGSIPVSMLDGIFEARLLERLDSLSHLVESKLVGHAPVDVYETEELAQVVSDLHRWHSEREDNAEIVLDHFQQIRAEIAHGVAGVGKSIAETKRQIATLKRDLEADRLQPFMDAIDREDCYTALKNLRASLASLERKQKEADDMTRQIEENGKRLVRASKLWPDMSIEKRKMFIRLVTQSVQLHDTGCGFMEMVVTWHPFMGHPQREIAHIMVQHGNAGNWSPEEIATLTEQYPRSEKSELVRLLPKRSWRTIIKKAHTLGIQRLQRSAQSDIPIDLSFETREYIQEYHLCEPEIGRAWWRVSPIKHDGRF